MAETDAMIRLDECRLHDSASSLLKEAGEGQ